MTSVEEMTKESEARTMYFKMYGKHMFGTASILAWGSYFVAKACIPGQKELFDKKFAFINEWQLGFVFGVWYIIYLTRQYLMINSNGARAGAGVERPDQHVYGKEGRDGEVDAVSMVNAGAKGRFNRAQRAAYNMDETLPLFGTGLLLSSTVFGPIALLPALMCMYGRIKFGNLYKGDLNNRVAGFMPSIVAEVWTSGLVFLCFLKGVVPAIAI